MINIDNLFGPCVIVVMQERQSTFKNPEENRFLNKVIYDAIRLRAQFQQEASNQVSQEILLFTYALLTYNKIDGSLRSMIIDQIADADSAVFEITLPVYRDDLRIRHILQLIKDETLRRGVTEAEFTERISQLHAALDQPTRFFTSMTSTSLPQTSAEPTPLPKNQV